MQPFKYMRLNDKGNDVIKLQKLLNKKGFSVLEDGVFGATTFRAVVEFQKQIGLTPDGIVGNQTLAGLQNLPVTTYATTLAKAPYFVDMNLDEKRGDFYKDIHVKNKICLLHTNTCSSPKTAYNKICWDRGSILSSKIAKASAFYIAGKVEEPYLSMLDIPHSNSQNGEIWRSYDEKYWSNSIPGAIMQSAISISICNWGGLEINSYGQLVNISGLVVPDEYVIDLGRIWRGYRYFHAYTDAQCESLIKLIQFLIEKFEIKFPKNVFGQNWWYEKHADAINGRSGIWNSSNYSELVDGISPQKNIISALNSL